MAKVIALFGILALMNSVYLRLGYLLPGTCRALPVLDALAVLNTHFRSVHRPTSCTTYRLLCLVLTDCQAGGSDCFVPRVILFHLTAIL